MSSCCTPASTCNSSTLLNRAYTVLASILSVLQTYTPITHLYAKVAAADIAAAFAVALSDEHRKLHVLVDNQTDQAMYVSFDGTNTHDLIKAGGSREWHLGELMRYEINKVYLAYVVDPSTGQVVITADY